MIIQDALRKISESSNDMVIHDLKSDTFFETNGNSNLNPMLPLYSEMDVKLIMSDEWEVMSYEDFIMNHQRRCKKIQDEFFSRRWCKK